MARGLTLLFAAMPCARSAMAAPVQISLSVPVFAQITGLTDVGFPSVDPNANAVNSQSDCVWENSLTQTYTVTATGSGTASAFTLDNGSGVKVPYSVGWAGTAGASSTTQVTASAPSGPYTTTALTPTCSIGAAASATLRITIGASDLQTMTGGSIYTGVLTLLISPI